MFFTTWVGGVLLLTIEKSYLQFEKLKTKKKAMYKWKKIKTKRKAMYRLKNKKLKNDYVQLQMKVFQFHT